MFDFVSSWSFSSFEKCFVYYSLFDTLMEVQCSALACSIIDPLTCTVCGNICLFVCLLRFYSITIRFKLNLFTCLTPHFFRCICIQNRIALFSYSRKSLFYMKKLFFLLLIANSFDRSQILCQHNTQCPIIIDIFSRHSTDKFDTRSDVNLFNF